MPTLFTTPPSVTVAKSEKIPISVSFAAMILAGDVLSAPTSVLWTSDGGTLALGVNPTLNVDGISVDQEIVGSILTAGQTYRLDVTVVLNPNKTVTGSINIYCPY